MQVLDGVKAGEEVVTSALFLIDSESKLREAAQTGSDEGDAELEISGMTLDDGDMSMESMRLDSGAEKNELDMAGMKLDEEPQP